MRRAALLALAVVLMGDPAEAAAPQVVYINFSDGSETLTSSDVDDAVTNQSSIGAVARYPPFFWPGLTDGTISRRDLIRTVSRQVNEAFLPYNVFVTTTRPASGPYTMVMVGGSPTLVGYDGRIAGIAFMDCSNRQPSNIVFAFPTALRGSVHGLYATIAQEAAHAFGLEHTVDPTDLMYPKIDPAQARFQDRDNAISGDRLCGQETQNSHRRLLDTVGAWPGGPKPFDEGGGPDLDPPVVIIREPGPTAPVPQPFTLRATVDDDGVVDHVTVEAGEQTFTATHGPYAWSLAGFPPGPLLVKVTAVDGNGNHASTSVALTVSSEETGGCAMGRRGGSGAGIILVLSCLARACSRGRRRL
jgi:hypothetical protein